MLVITSSEDDGDDVFPKCKEILQSSRQNGGGLEKQRRGTCGQVQREEFQHQAATH